MAKANDPYNEVYSSWHRVLVLCVTLRENQRATASILNVYWFHVTWGHNFAVFDSTRRLPTSLVCLTVVVEEPVACALLSMTPAIPDNLLEIVKDLPLRFLYSCQPPPIDLTISSPGRGLPASPHLSPLLLWKREDLASWRGREGRETSCSRAVVDALSLPVSPASKLARLLTIVSTLSIDLEILRSRESSFLLSLPAGKMIFQPRAAIPGTDLTPQRSVNSNLSLSYLPECCCSTSAGSPPPYLLESQTCAVHLFTFFHRSAEYIASV